MRSDRLSVFPGGLGVRIHGDRSGVTLHGPAVNYGNVAISRSKAADLIRGLRHDGKAKRLVINGAAALVAAAGNN
jgi:hypothetical protein